MVSDFNSLIYVLGNELFPGKYKIGYTTDLEQRLNSFNNNSGVCSSYKCYIVWFVNDSNYDRVIHDILDSLNPSIRILKDKRGKVSKTEFYDISLDKLWNLLYGCAGVYNSVDLLFHATYEDGSLYIYNNVTPMTLLFDSTNKKIIDNHVYVEDVNCLDVEKNEALSFVDDIFVKWWKEEGSQVNYAWDRIPWVLLYGSYKWWCSLQKIECEGLKKFCKEFRLRILPHIGDMWYEPHSSKFAVYSAWDIPEPLIGKYNIDELKNPNYTGKDWYKLGSNGGQYKSQYRGLCKVVKNKR